MCLLLYHLFAYIHLSFVDLPTIHLLPTHIPHVNCICTGFTDFIVIQAVVTRTQSCFLHAYKYATTQNKHCDYILEV